MLSVGFGRAQGAAQDDQSLGRSGHGDVPVDTPLDAGAERLRIDQHDQVELESLGQLRREGPDARDG